MKCLIGVMLLVSTLPAAQACKTLAEVIPGYNEMTVLGPLDLPLHADLVFAGTVSQVTWVPGKGHRVTYAIERQWRGPSMRTATVFVDFWPETKAPAQLNDTQAILVSAAHCPDDSYGSPVSFTAMSHDILAALGKPKTDFSEKSDNANQ